MTKSAIVLAGGFGTRLRSVVQDVPKPMALVGEQPFLTYVLDHIVSFGIEHIVLSLGYQYQVILEHFGYEYKGAHLSYSIEHMPLGTGGAIFKGYDLILEDTFFVFNGDSLFKIDLHSLQQLALEKSATVALALKEMRDFDRYGVVDSDDDQKVLAFKEKQATDYGFINGGVYWLDKKAFEVALFPRQFSFEKDFLESYTENLSLYAFPMEGYFIDIGIPEDYSRAQEELCVA